MELECSCEEDCVVKVENLEEILESNQACSHCRNINLKKFKTIDQQMCLETLDDDFGRCVCGKRPLDIVMAHVLKIMAENGIAIKSLTLRNGAIPLIKVVEGGKENIHLGKDSLIVLHPEFTKEIAEKLIEEVSEVKGVLKGNSNELVGKLDIDTATNSYQLLSGCDIRCDIVRSPKGKIILNKKQSQVHLEFAPSIENKILKLDNYFKGEYIEDKIGDLSILDGTCGCGSLGIYSLKYGFKNVFFNDISDISIKLTETNLKANGYNVNKSDNDKDKDLIYYGDNFKVYNLSLEELVEKLEKKEIVITEENNEENKFDYCILDIFPQGNAEYFTNLAKKIAKNVIFI